MSSRGQRMIDMALNKTSDTISEVKNNSDTRMDTVSSESDEEPFQDSGSDFVPSSLESTSSNEEASPEFSPITPKQRKKTFKKNIGKKRLSFPKEWERNKIKYSVNRGISYINRSGKTVSAKNMSPGCTESCFLKCYDKVSADQRSKIFKNFWDIGNKTRQWGFILEYSDTIAIKRKNISASDRRSCARKYYLPINEQKTPVCCKTFIDTLGINYQWIQTAYSKRNASEGVLSDDKRGKFIRPINLQKQKLIDGVREHIRSFPMIESHYTRERSSRNYIDGNLSVSKMFYLYLEHQQENAETEIATLRQYRDIFNKDFNISFFTPKKDQCEVCSSFQNMSEEEKALAFNDYNMHLEMKSVARELKEKDKKEAKDSYGKVVSACFDFQKVLISPSSDVSIFYYSRKLSSYNFTVYDMSTKDAFCYVWDQTIAMKGSDEVCSALYKFILQEHAKGVEEFRFWSDNCSGQNRNRFVFGFYSWISKKLQITITHTFLEKGHTQNEGDSVHAVIERAKKNSIVYIPAQWYSIIRNAKTSKPPYHVIEMCQDEVFSFKNFVKQTNWKKDIDGNQVMWNQIRSVKVENRNSFKLLFKIDLSKDWKECYLYEINNKRGRKKVCPYSNALERKYRLPIPVGNEKYKDLQKLVTGNYIPKIYQPFYLNLIPDAAVESENESDD